MLLSQWSELLSIVGILAFFGRNVSFSQKYCDFIKFVIDLYDENWNDIFLVICDIYITNKAIADELMVAMIGTLKYNFFTFCQSLFTQYMQFINVSGLNFLYIS